MLIRIGGGRHRVALPRLPSTGALQTTSRFSGTQYKSLSISRRLLTTRQELRPWRKRTVRGGVGFFSERSLATALSDYGLRDDMSVDGIPKSSYAMYSSPTSPRLWELRPFDTSSPLVVGAPGLPLPRERINRSGIPGDIDEMLSILDACLHIGKLDRAGMVLKRLAKHSIVAGVDLMDLHNRFLRASVDQLLLSPNSNRADQLHKWYELEIRARNLSQTPETIAYMLKASLLTARGSRLERLVDRYMGMVPVTPD